MKEKTCPVCSGSSKYDLTKDSCEYFRCKNCEFLFHPVKSEILLTKARTMYDSEYWEKESNEAKRRQQQDAFLRALELIWISRHKVVNILDFGCGHGLTVEMLRKIGFNAIGFDPNGQFEESSFLIKSMENLCKIFPQGYFDAIFSVEVFEHLPDPVSAFKTIDYMLNPGGMILINTGTQEFLKRQDKNLNYIDPTVRGHISIYSLKTFTKLGSMFGYDASFLGDRKYEVILQKNGLIKNEPVNENLQTFTTYLGDWFPLLFREYIRLVLSHKD